MFANDVPVHIIKRLGRWKSSCFEVYLRMTPGQVARRANRAYTYIRIFGVGQPLAVGWLGRDTLMRVG